MKKCVLAIALMLSSQVALAADSGASNYWAVNVGTVVMDSSALPRSDLGGVMLSALVGYELLPYLGIEARIGSSIADEKSVAAGSLEGRIEYFGSALLRLNVLTDDVRPYLLLGGSYLEASVSGAGFDVSDDESGLAWGAGISLHVRDAAVQFEYVRYLDKDDFVIDGFNAGILIHF